MSRLVFVVVLAMGCASRPHVMIPRTQEGMECYRQCLGVFNQCRVTEANPIFEQCKEQNRDCLRTCPGAYEKYVRNE